ncbi:MAG: peptide chain release factor N(5)-glutamine methyltransferase [Lachnospiraceae bacterium]
MISYKDCLDMGVESLESAQITDAAVDAWILFEAVFSLTKADYYLCMYEPVQEIGYRKYCAYIKRRCGREPVQYITGIQNFYGFDFRVSPAVLIPRQDTECLIERIISEQSKGIRLLDMCTGSGCIGITLSLLLEAEKITLVDVSEKALAVAQENARLLGVPENTLTVLQSDLFLQVPEDAYDVIVSNPPYIASAECETLMEEVKSHEPRLALDGAEDGLRFYRKITEQATHFLKKGGWLYYEIGYDQREAVMDMMQTVGFTDVVCVQDLAGLDRIVYGKWDR